MSTAAADPVTAAGLLPPRLSAIDAAARALAAHGAVILPGQPVIPATLVRVAAELLGTDLRRVEPVRHTLADAAESLGLHTDGATVTYRTRAGELRWRSPDDDLLLQLCVQPATEGGQSVLVDGYALVDGLRADPRHHDLAAFLTEVDLDYLGRHPGGERGANQQPFVGRTVEHTRAGRRIVTVSDLATPLPRHPDRDRQVRQLEEWLAAVARAYAAAPRFTLAAGDVLCIDNYRMLHGRDAYRGRRALYVMTARSAQAA